MRDKKFFYFFEKSGLPVVALSINHKSHTNITTMKKLLVVLAIGTFAACSNGTSTGDAKDSTVDAIDSTKDAKLDAIDSTKDVKDSTLNAAKDTVKADAKAAKDSAKGKK